MGKDAVIEDLPEVPVQQLYRTMDFALEADENLQREVYWGVGNHLNLEVDLLYFDTTSRCFEIEAEDDFGKKGHSKTRPDLPQVLIGLAVTCDGIPVRCWAWPGNTSDMSVIREIRGDLGNCRLGRVITMLDREVARPKALKR